jgi:release factor glutamine methyltransferase
LRAGASELLREAARTVSRADAEFLLMHLLKRRRHELYSGARVPPRAVRRFHSLVRKALSGAPVQYLTHSAPFLDLELYVDRRVMIPRPETEELVARALARLRGRQPAAAGPRLLVDYGTGSGCIAVALARSFPESRVLAIDRSLPALAVARRNVRGYGLERRVKLIHARCLNDAVFARLKGRVDLVISNPPYVPAAHLARLPGRVRDHEPKMSLDGGPKGTNIVAMLLAHGPRLLKPRGLLAMEVDWSHGPFVRRLAPSAEVEKDLSGRIRYAFLTRSAST